MDNITNFPDLGPELTRKIIQAAIAVHKHFGPGLLESLYEECLVIELTKAGLKFKKQPSLSVEYDGQVIENAFRVDLWVEDKVIVEIKSTEKLAPIHEAQILTYMRLTKSPLGLLVNFNEKLLKDGVKRFALSEFDEPK
jgi:GxxExxY protein